MSCALSTIERHCGKTFGGLKSIKLFLDSAVDTLPVQYCSPNLSGDITLGSGESFHEIKFDRFTAQFTERKLINRRAGDYYEQTLTFDITHDRAEVATLINNLDNRRTHAVIVDRNDKQRLLKNLRQRNTTDSGDALSSFNGNKFILISRTKRRSPFITGNLVDGNPVVDPCDITIQGDFSGPSATSGLDAGEYYALTAGNVFSLPEGIVIQHNPPQTWNSDSTANSNGVSLGSCYVLSSSNIYGMPTGVAKKIITGSTTTYDSDALSNAGGVSVGETYTLSSSNIYSLPAGILKKRIS